MFGQFLKLGKLSALFFAASCDNNNYSFRDEKLKGALSYYQEAQELAVQGEYQEACEVYMLGIFMGRKSVQRLLEEEESKEGEHALDWLVSSYMACCQARIHLEDWNAARSDAWAACSYSQSQNLKALECMLMVCEKTDDCLGELQTLKSIQQLILQTSSMEDTVPNTKFHAEDIEQRIGNLETELERKYKNNE